MCLEYFQYWKLRLGDKSFFLYLGGYWVLKLISEYFIFISWGSCHTRDVNRCPRKIILQDIGVLQTNNKHVRYFNNVAGLGYDGFIVNKLKKLKPFGSLSYILAGAYGLLFYKKSVFKVSFDKIEVETNCLMTILGICKYSGNGMRFTKDVHTSDGFLDITIAKNITLLDLLLNITKLYNGKFVNHKKVETYKTKEITVQPKISNPYIQADGELVGTGKVTVKIIEKAIKFVIN